MEIFIKYLEGQLNCAKKYANDRQLIQLFQHNAYGATSFYSYKACLEGDMALMHEIDKLWEEKYSPQFDELIEKTLAP